MIWGRARGTYGGDGECVQVSGTEMQVCEKENERSPTGRWEEI
jgi:hypothetical protein